ncbi:ribonuclease R [Anopheles sinensis]|uniref:Ribonuclease R n=1 Tax=Anopheles sinensis TaxID=74873 RepID=A0A084VZY7_ANOSI|nr:ribonuclease R [Anopheles sinensis]
MDGSNFASQTRPNRAFPGTSLLLCSVSRPPGKVAFVIGPCGVSAWEKRSRLKEPLAIRNDDKTTYTTTDGEERACLGDGAISEQFKAAKAKRY